MIDSVAIHDFAVVLSRTETDESALAFLEATTKRLFDHILFTALRFDHPNGVMTRIYTNREDVSPIGGTKPIPTDLWADRIMTARQCYIGYSREDIREVFPDHEALLAIGCESVMNVPVVWQDRSLGSINLLGRERQFSEAHTAPMVIFAQLALPLFIGSLKRARAERDDRRFEPA